MVESGRMTALGGGVGDVALVPEGDVFKGGLGVGADDAREAGDLLGEDGVALVGHGARALLFFGEELLGFADLGALEVADFSGDLVEGGAEDGEGTDVGGVAVALDDLGGDVYRPEAEGVADGLLVGGLEVAEGADGSGELADAEVFGGGVEAGEVALHLGEPEEELEAEGGGFGVDAVGAADDWGAFELRGAAGEDVGELQDAFADLGGGFLELEGLGGVYDVGGGEAVVEPAGFGADVLGYRGGEGDDVVLDLGFNLVDAVDGEGGLVADGVGGFLGDDSGFGEGLRGGDFDLEPAAVFIFVGPDAGHLGAGCSAGSWVYLTLCVGCTPSPPLRPKVRPIKDLGLDFYNGDKRESPAFAGLCAIWSTSFVKD